MALNSVVSLAASNSPAGSIEGDALVIGVVKGSDGPALLDSPLAAEETAALNESLSSLGVTGNADGFHRLPAPAGVEAKVLVLAGLGAIGTGPDAAPSPEALRRAAGSALRQLAGTDTVVLALPAAEAAQLTAIAEGAALGAYSYQARRSDPAGLRVAVARHPPAKGLTP